MSVFDVENLGYDYPGGITALRGLSFRVTAGEALALVGANGAGKSTLLKLLDGLIFPSAGKLTAFGQPLTEQALRDARRNSEFRRRVGLVFQDPDVQLFSPTVWEEVTFAPLQLGLPQAEVMARGEEAMELLQVTHLRERPPYRLSGGEKKRVALASVIALGPEVLLLDEPTAGLDPQSQGKLIDFLMRWTADGRNLIFSTQDLDLVEEIASRVLVLGAEHGLVADGHPEEFLMDAAFLLRTNLIHEHAHRHKSLIHRHQHFHEHQHES
ncbi:MAG TPA: ABC transporter ATP-binding protein [bacterium]|nr:ABC transporter ATP-binding protein [bacterium]